MNRYMQEKWSWVEGTVAARNDLMNALTDADLRFNPGGQNMTLGALCKEAGEIDYAYLQSLKTLTQNFDYRHNDASVGESVEKLKAWLQSMHEDMKATLSAMSDDDIKKTIVRGAGFEVPVEVQMDIYLQALLIFLGKASIFMRAIGKPLPGSMADWIG